MSTIIDIHPHIIADDTVRYPLAPLGGHQSDWSRTRPVTTEQMIAAMDKAGVAKSAIVQASTCYGHDNSYVADAVAAHPGPLHRGVLRRRAGARRARAHAPLASAAGSPACGCSPSAAPCRTRRRGSTIRRPIRPGNAPASLGISICLQMSPKAFPQMIKMARALPQGADHPRPHGAAGAGGRTALRGRRQPVRRSPATERLSQADPAHFHRSRAKARRAGNLLSQAGVGVRRIAAGLGLELSVLGRLAARASRAREELARILAAERPGLDFGKTAQTLYPALAN